jgi:hypothetical protein
VILCPLQTPTAWDQGEIMNGVDVRHTYGCRMAYYITIGYEFAGFSIAKHRVRNMGLQIQQVDWGLPSEFLLLMDTVSDEGPAPWDYGDRSIPSRRSGVPGDFALTCGTRGAPMRRSVTGMSNR